MLQFFASRQNALLNILEISLDWVFPTEHTKTKAFELLCQYYIKTYHRDHGIRFFKGITRYTGPRKASNVVAIYGDKRCRVNREPFCVHLDWRTRTVAALRRAGIASVSDLLLLDAHEFWSKRLLMRAVDRGHLGRLVNNAFLRTNRRSPWIMRRPLNSGKIFTYHHDQRVGSLIVRKFGSTQAVIDQYRHKIRVAACLRGIDVNHLLPPPGARNHR